MSGDRGSVSGVLVCWSLDLGSTPDRSLSFSFPLDHLGLSILTTKLNTSLPGHKEYLTIYGMLVDCRSGDTDVGKLNMDFLSNESTLIWCRESVGFNECLLKVKNILEN